MTIRASDQRNPERVDDSVFVININRDQFPPIFTNEPYGTNIVDSQTLNQTIYTVRAQDQDLAGNLVYEAIGVYPAQSFFGVDRNTGNVFTRRNLKEDGIGRESYVLRVITYDDADPRLQDTADVRITVTRNPSTPTWTRQQYQETVNEEYSSVLPVLTVSAVDSDGVSHMLPNIMEWSPLPLL